MKLVELEFHMIPEYAKPNISPDSLFESVIANEGQTFIYLRNLLFIYNDLFHFIDPHLQLINILSNGYFVIQSTICRQKQIGGNIVDQFCKMWSLFLSIHRSNIRCKRFDNLFGISTLLSNYFLL